MLGGEVRQPLQLVLLRQKAAEPLHGLIVPLPGAEAPLAVVPVELIKLREKVVILV